MLQNVWTIGYRPCKKLLRFVEICETGELFPNPAVRINSIPIAISKFWGEVPRATRKGFPCNLLAETVLNKHRDFIADEQRRNTRGKTRNIVDTYHGSSKRHPTHSTSTTAQQTVPSGSLSFFDAERNAGVGWLSQSKDLSAVMVVDDGPEAPKARKLVCGGQYDGANRG
jgi:hypothetical protein